MIIHDFAKQLKVRSDAGVVQAAQHVLDSSLKCWCEPHVIQVGASFLVDHNRNDC